MGLLCLTQNKKEMMTMKNILKKIGMMLLTMVIVSFFAFLAFQVIPGDPTIKLLGSDATAEAVAELRAGVGSSVFHPLSGVGDPRRTGRFRLVLYLFHAGFSAAGR